MTWHDCVRMATERNPDLRAARATLDASIHSAKAAYGGFYPQVTLDLSANKGNTYSFSDVSGASTAFGSTRALSAGVTATQNLFSGFEDTALVEQGAANREASSFSVDVTKAQVSYDLKSAFAGLLYAQDADQLAQRITRRREEN